MNWGHDEEVRLSLAGGVGGGRLVFQDLDDQGLSSMGFEPGLKLNAGYLKLPLPVFFQFPTIAKVGDITEASWFLELQVVLDGKVRDLVLFGPEDEFFVWSEFIPGGFEPQVIREAL